MYHFRLFKPRGTCTDFGRAVHVPILARAVHVLILAARHMYHFRLFWPRGTCTDFGRAVHVLKKTKNGTYQKRPVSVHRPVVRSGALVKRPCVRQPTFFSKETK